MKVSMPQIVQYQGSKRKLAPQILSLMPKRFERLIEPFSGMAAMSIATAYEGRASHYVLNDVNKDVVAVLQAAIDHPQELITAYTEVWEAQFTFAPHSEAHYYSIRERFNNGEHTAAFMLYLLARCVKGSVRYNAKGEFNQSPDKRRAGTHPKTLAENVTFISHLLKGHTSFYATDFEEVLDEARPGDLVYLDPPYQGVSHVRDHRYIAGLALARLAGALEELNRRGVDYLLSYDGRLGDKCYGEELPSMLGLTRIDLNAGLSTQALFLGKKVQTVEALYLSPGLKRRGHTPKPMAVQYCLNL